MPEVTEYTPGTPSWVDLASPDVEASKRFYGGLFGWSAEASSDPAAGGYVMFNLRGKSVAGLAPAQAGMPTLWSSYVTVRDADATVRAAKAASGSVLVEPMDVLDVGRMAVLGDPAGAAISIWQPRAHIGAELVNEPGTFCWSELQSRDLDGVTKWYEQTFGWTCAAMEGGPMVYTEVRRDGEFVAGMMPMPAEVPAEVPSHWAIYFAVADCAASVAKAEALGGSVTVPPQAIPPGTMASLADPQGAVFHVLQFAEDDS